MIDTIEHSPKLQPPGAGLPTLELIAGRIIVGWQLRTSSVNKALRVFVEEKAKVLSLVRGVSPAPLAARRVLIKRLAGLEDSSRYWSLYMTVDHLNIVTHSITETVRSLAAGVIPSRVVSTAAVKPREDADESVLLNFQTICDAFESSFSAHTLFDPKVTLAHPWFGELNARQWHFFAGFHLKLHRKQIEAIKVGLAALKEPL